MIDQELITHVVDTFGPGYGLAGVMASRALKGSDGTDKLTRGLGLALYKLGSSGQEYFICSHFGAYFPDIFALKFHFLSKNKLTCHI